jgi:putative tryptophan/tyrosine transport system substrate-binding protein
MNNRRKLVIALGASALTAPFSSFAQQQSKVRRIGWISNDSGSGNPPMFAAFREGLRDLGYVEGRDVVIDARWGEGSDERLEQLAVELVKSKPDVIVTQGGPATHPVINAGATMPVVFGYSGDPVEAAVVSSLARPGRNFTGMTFLSFDLVGKRLELLKEVMPGLKRIAILANPQHPGEQGELRVSRAAAKALGLSFQYFQAQNAAKVEDALAAILKSHSEAVDVFPDGLLIRSRERIAEFSIKNRIPAISGWSEFAESGNLMSYGPNLRDAYRRLATYVDKIFKGAKPADLPVELPTTVELVVNLRAAKALGIKIPNSILVRATKVIE